MKLGELVMIHVSSTLPKMVSLQGRSLQSFDKHIKTQMGEVCKAPVLKFSLGNCSKLVGKLVELLAAIELSCFQRNRVFEQQSWMIGFVGGDNPRVCVIPEDSCGLAILPVSPLPC